jgi:prepilin-type N-terminal cleavage/methylation domain-containing protein
MIYQLTIQNGKKGLTLVEVLVVLIIIAVIASLSYLAFVSLSKTQILERDASALISFIEEARSSTLASKEASQYGVYISEEENKAVFFKGASFVEGAPQNVEFLFNNNVSVSVNLVDGESSAVVFDRLKGTVSAHGSIILSLVSDPATTLTIAIYPTGASELLP